MKIKIALMCWAVTAGAVVAEEKTETLQKELQSFFIPGAVLEDAKLGDVAGALEKSYRKYSKAVSGTERALKIVVNDGADRTLSGVIPSQSIESTLFQIAGQAGMSVAFEEGRVQMSPLKQDDRKVEVKMTVSHDFIQKLEMRLKGQIVFGTPRDGVTPGMLATGVLTQVFRELGLFEDLNSTVSMIPGMTPPTVKSSAHELARVRTFLKSLDQPPRQLRITTKIFSSPKGFSVEPGRFGASKIGEMALSASREEGFEFVTFPSLVALPGQEGMLEVIRKTALFDDDAWTGHKLTVATDLRGDGMAGEFEFRNRQIDGHGKEVREIALSEKFQLLDGETLIRKLGERGGRTELLLLTAEVIDATGRRVEPANHRR